MYKKLSIILLTSIIITNASAVWPFSSNDGKEYKNGALVIRDPNCNDPEKWKFAARNIYGQLKVPNKVKKILLTPHKGSFKGDLFIRTKDGVFIIPTDSYAALENNSSIRLGRDLNKAVMSIFRASKAKFKSN
jgi:hypothetical protein